MNLIADGYQLAMIALHLGPNTPEDVRGGDDAEAVAVDGLVAGVRGALVQWVSRGGACASHDVFGAVQ